MKISKLFHWLYAILMLLPILYVLSRSLYVIFNDNATSLVSLDNIFIDSLNNLTTINIFSWSLDSFLVVPFNYILNIFSCPTNSCISVLLSYWISLSIIWLVFDIVMYLPLLIHRYLDKGIIE